MGKIIDLTGRRVGKLTVLEHVKSDRTQAMWKCRCDCGVEQLFPSSQLRRNAKLTCGCVHPRRIDLCGRRFGRLMVISQAGHNARGSMAWHCACDCGVTLKCEGAALRSGNTQSCGCARTESLRRRAINLMGQRFGQLVVKSRAPNNERQNAMWVCECDCGGEATATSYALRHGHTRSCGCFRRRCGSLNHTFTGAGDLPGQYVSNVRISAKKRGLECSVTAEELWALFQEQRGLCALTGQPIVLQNRRNGTPVNGASLDRIDSSRGYIAGNIHWVDKRINNMKQAYAVPEFVSLCLAVARHHFQFSLS